MRFQPDELREVIRAPGHAGGYSRDSAAAAVFHRPAPVFVVDVHHHTPGHIREHSLCEVVILHRAVVIQMILREIRECAHGEALRREAVLRKRHGACLQEAVFCADIRHLPEKLIQLPRLRSSRWSVVGVLKPPAGIAADSPYNSCLVTERPGYLRAEVDRSGLAVGSCNRAQFELPGGSAVECGQHLRIQPPALRNIYFRGKPQGTFRHYRAGALFQHCRRGAVPVETPALYAHEQESRLDLPVIGGHARDLRIPQRFRYLRDSAEQFS